MKIFSKQILEAVDRGIKLALDDYEDIDQNSSISPKGDVIDSEDAIKQKIELMNEVVDLGLPSGTLWHKYNLGVNQNQLSKSKDWYGDYYAFGELKPNKINKKGKFYFDWDNYKFGKKYNKLTKYCNDPKCGYGKFFDNLMELLPEDDVVCKKMKLHNFKFHIPTKDQCEELMKYTNSYWVKNYDPNKTIHNSKNDKGIKGLNGRVFIGQNGNTLFIPAVGFYNGSYNGDVGFYCYMWSSSLYLDNSNCAYYLNFDSEFIRMNGGHRCNGLSIRPVINL